MPPRLSRRLGAPVSNEERNITTTMGVFARAMRGGAKVVGLRSLEWDLSKGCQSPVSRYYEATIYRQWLWDKFLGDVAYEFRDFAAPVKPPAVIKVDVVVACRKCSTCLRHRARLWAARARAEVSQHERTWLLTLTLDGNARVKLLFRGRLALQRRGWSHTDFRERGDARVLAQEMLKEWTLMVKRLRKAKHKVRYLAVVEYHKDGFPHMHVLVHCAESLTYRALCGEWQHGFTHAKLADIDAARYVAKYVTKDLSRLRASLGYGRRSITHSET